MRMSEGKQWSLEDSGIHKSKSLEESQSAAVCLTSMRLHCYSNGFLMATMLLATIQSQMKHVVSKQYSQVHPLIILVR